MEWHKQWELKVNIEELFWGQIWLHLAVFESFMEILIASPINSEIPGMMLLFVE